MKLIDTYARLSQAGLAAWETSEVAAYLGIPTSHASTLLARLAKAGQVVRLRQGVWAFRQHLDSLALPGLVTRPFPTYVSLQSALYYHNLVSQIPSVIYAVSLARTRVFQTPLGTVSIHHLDPSFFFGFESVGEHGVQMATAEKALLDVLYLMPAKSLLFRTLPEIEFPAKFDFRAAQSMIQRIPFKNRRTLVAAALEKLVSFTAPA